jgi:hypothetical protein
MPRSRSDGALKPAKHHSARDRMVLLLFSILLAADGGNG